MKVRLADLTIEIKDDNEKLLSFFKNYLTDTISDFVLEIDTNDIKREKDMFFEEYLDDFDYCLLAIYRKIAEILPFYDGFVLHGSAVYYDATASVLSGVSGAGKSTHANLLQKYKNIHIINDDKPIVRIVNNIPYVYGTPWGGKHQINEKISKPLKSIVFVEKDKTNNIIKLNKDDSYIKTLRQTYRPIYNSDNLVKTLDLVNRVVKATTQYELQCDISKQATDISFEIIK